MPNSASCSCADDSNHVPHLITVSQFSEIENVPVFPRILHCLRDGSFPRISFTTRRYLLQFQHS